MTINSEYYQSVFFDLKSSIINNNYSARDVSKKIYDRFHLKDYPLLFNCTRNNNYLDARDALYSSESTYFYFVDLELLKVNNKDDLLKLIYNKYSIELDKKFIDKIFINEQNNIYFDWNYFNLMILLITKKIDNIENILDIFNGNLIESYILEYDMFIDFKELFEFNKIFISKILNVLFFEESISLKKKYFNKYYFEKFNEKNKKTINEINFVNKIIERYYEQEDLNLLNQNKDFYYPENNMEIEKYSLLFGNCIDSKKFKLKLFNNEIFFVVNEKKMICFSYIDNIILELRGYDNKEITDDEIIKEVKEFINENS